MDRRTFLKAIGAGLVAPGLISKAGPKPELTKNKTDHKFGQRSMICDGAITIPPNS